MAARVLVTGGAGFLGRHLSQALLEAGFAVRVFDRLPRAAGPWTSDGEPLADLEYVEGDVRDTGALSSALTDCQAVCHLAGTPQLWLARRGLFDAVNHRGTVRVIEAALAAGCARVLHVSDATIWPEGGWSQGGCDGRRLSEAAGPYGRSKLRAERFALDMARRGAPVVIVAPTLPIGPGDDHLTPPTQMLLDFCLQPRREYLATMLNVIDVRDLARAMVQALRVGQPGRPYLLGNHTVTVPDLVEGLGRPRPTRIVPYRWALAVAYLGEWWAAVCSGRPPVATIEGVRLSRRRPPEGAAEDMARLGVVPRPLDHTLADVAAWFHEMGWVADSGHILPLSPRFGGRGPG